MDEMDEAARRREEQQKYLKAIMAVGERKKAELLEKERRRWEASFEKSK